MTFVFIKLLCFPLMKWKKEGKRQVITKSHFYSRRQMIQSSETLKNLTIFFTGLFVPYKQVKVSQTELLKLKHLYSMCKEVVYKQSIVMNQNNAYFNSIVFPGSRNENNKAQKICCRSIWFSSYLKLTLRTGNINEICK